RIWSTAGRSAIQASPARIRSGCPTTHHAANPLTASTPSTSTSTTTTLTLPRQSGCRLRFFGPRLAQSASRLRWRPYDQGCVGQGGGAVPEDAGLTIGVDIGGTKVAAGVVDERGAILATTHRDTPANDVQQIEDAIAAVVAELASSYRVG